MEGTLVLILVLTFLFGGLMLALVMGYCSLEESRRAQLVAAPAKAPTAADVGQIPSFFAKLETPGFTVAAVAFDDAVLARVAQHVRAEHAMVAQFVHYPSIDSLYRQSGSSLHVH